MKSLLIKLTIILFAFRSSVYSAVSETVLLSNILSQTTAQLKEVKDILELQDATLKQVEKANSQVQQARYRLLRMKYLVEASQNLANSNTRSSQEVINLMRNAKNLKGNATNILNDSNEWVQGLDRISEEERQHLLSIIDSQENDLNLVKRNIENRKLALTHKKLSNKISQDHLKNTERNLEVIVQENESMSANDSDGKNAQVNTAKNTALTNTILHKQLIIQNETLKETQAISDNLERAEIERLEKERKAKALWEYK